MVPDISGFGDELKAKIDAETRSMGDVSIPVKFDVDQASLAAARAALGPLGGQTVPVRFDVDQASAVKAREALGPLAGETVPVEIAVDPASIAKANAEIRAGLGAEREPQVEVGAKADLASVVAANAAIKATLDALSPGDTVKLRFDADTGAVVAATVAEVTAAKAAADLARATDDAGNSAYRAGGWFGFLGQKVTLFGGAVPGISVWHLALDAIVEWAAVAIPGMLAFGAAAAAADPTIVDLVNHQKAMSVVTNATRNDLTKLDQTYDNINTSVHIVNGTLELYGAALNARGAAMGAFGQVAQGVIVVFDQWAATIDLWVNSGARGFLNVIGHEAVPDLTKFGQILGNLAGAFANLLRSMPGIAEILLSLVDDFSGLLRVVTSITDNPIGKWVVEVALALHGLYAWGGLAATGLMKLVTPVAALANLFPETSAIGGWGAAVKTATANAADGKAGVAGLRAAVAGLADPALLIGAGLISAALIGMIMVMDRGKISAYNYGAAMQSSLSSVNFTTGLNAAINNITLLAVKQTDAAQAAKQYGDEAVAANVKNAAYAEVLHQNAQFAAADAKTYHDSLTQQQQDVATAGQLIGSLAKTYGTTYQQAAIVADLANVRLGESYKEMWQQVQNLVAGYGGLHAVMGMLGSDEQAVTFATELQNSKLQQLNQSWDTFISTVQAPSSTFLTFARDIVQFGNDAQATGASLSGLGTGVISSAKKVTTAALQLRQDFNAVVSGAEPMLDSLRTAALVTGDGGPVVKGIKDTIAVLIPLAGKSTEARDQIYAMAQEAGYAGPDNLKSLAAWVGKVNNPLQALDTLTGNAARALANLGVDAQSLAQTLQSTLNQTLVNQAESLTGVSAKTLTYLQDLKQYGPNAAATQQALASVNDAQNTANSLVTQGAAGITTLTGNVSKYGAELTVTQAARQALNSDIGKILNIAPGAGADINAMAAAVQNHGVKSQQYQQARAQLISDLEKSGESAATATGQVDGYTKSIQNIPASKVLDLTEQATGSWNIQEKLTKTSGVGGILPTPSGNAAGGLIIGGSGRPKADDIPARLSRNEYVVQADAVKHYGTGFFDQVNAKQFAAGGIVKGGASLDAHQNHVLHLEHLHRQHAEHVKHLEHLHREHEKHLTHLRHEGKLPRIPAVHHPSGHIPQPHAKAVAHHAAARKKSAPRPLDAHQKHVAHVKHLEHLHHEHEEHIAHQRRMKIPGFAGGGLAGGTYSGTPTGMGAWTTSEYNSTVTGMETELEKAVNTAIAAAKKSAAAAAAAGGYNSVPAQSGSAAAAQRFASAHLAQFGWGQDQMPPLIALWNQESGWSDEAVNKSSGAYGIPQSLGHGHPYNLGDYANQVMWGLNYIKGTYGSPAAAESHERSHNWYGRGGVIPEPVTGIGLRSGDRYHFGERGPETVTPGVGGTGAGVNINYYGPQRPSPEQEQAILMKASAMIGVS